MMLNLNDIPFLLLFFILGAIIPVVFFCIALNSKNKEINRLKEENIKIDTELKAKNEINKSKEAILELVKNEFSHTANEILINKQISLQEQNKISLESFLTPLKEKIKDFQDKVEKADKDGNSNTATIKTKIEDLIQQTKITTEQTERLSNAISQNSKFRGILGEMILDKLLKSSGLINKKDNLQGNYETQKGFKSKGESKSVIVDVVIYLADGEKNVIIDSKASLVNFIEFSNSNSKEEREHFLSAFLNDIKARVKELSGKYASLEGLVTPDFTIMFVPFEASLGYIYSDSRLIEDAMKQNIIIEGPSALIATLRAINNSWAQKNQYDNIKEITRLGTSIYEKCVTLIEKLEGVQTSFETVKKRFGEVFSTAKGRGGLLGQVDKLRAMGLTPAKEIDKKYLEETGVELGQ